jgi:hypothetical protein|tara:strand:+ start:124650 stop:124931 length:282 start_codon:yes stop_codon:yes gene_type:complete
MAAIQATDTGADTAVTVTVAVILIPPMVLEDSTTVVLPSGSEFTAVGPDIITDAAATMADIEAVIAADTVDMADIVVVIMDTMVITRLCPVFM